MADRAKNPTKVDRLYRILTRGFVFVVVLVLLLAGANSFLQPVWFYENNYHTYTGFYEEPHNSIETIFVGASMTLFGFSPMEMYEQDGINAYNLASSSQPMMASYFWTKEAYRLHNETLDTVVLDISMLRRLGVSEDYHRALDGMDASSPVYNEVIDALTDGPVEALLYRFPLFGYHDRWASIDYTDFVKYGTQPEVFARGYFMEFSRIFETTAIEDIPVPAQVLDPDEPADTSFEDEALFYFKKLIEFCEENNLRLVFCKTPSPSNWSSSEHNSIQEIADAYGIDFVDFEFEPLLSELDYCVPLDSKDTDKHLNYYGAMKLSKWMSTYLKETCGNRDERNGKFAARLNAQLDQYRNKIRNMGEATYATDVTDYLQKVTSANGFTVLVSVKDDAAANLTAAQRMAFSYMGLTELSTIQVSDSYLAVITDGKVEIEKLVRHPSWFDKDVESFIDKNGLNQDEAQDIRESLEAVSEGEWEEEEEIDSTASTYSGVLSDGTNYTVKSAGVVSGNMSSCVIGKAEYSKNSRGINIVVYDNDSHRVVDSTVFDTCLSSTKPTLDYQTTLKESLDSDTKYENMPRNIQQLYRYQSRYGYALEGKKLRLEIGSGGLYYYLDHYCHRSGLLVMIAVKDDAAESLSDGARALFADMGLVEFSKIGPQESYCAIFENGTVTEEQRSSSESVSIERNGITISSGGYWSGNFASIVIDQVGTPTNYASNGRGVNIVVYNPKLDIVVDTAYFDTHDNEVDLP